MPPSFVCRLSPPEKPKRKKGRDVFRGELQNAAPSPGRTCDLERAWSSLPSRPSVRRMLKFGKTNRDPEPGNTGFATD
jgi:hypothetical protein